jgi:SCF-associated factor 1
MFGVRNDGGARFVRDKNQTRQTGTLDGSSAALRSDGYSEATKAATTPLKLQLPTATRSIRCVNVKCIIYYLFMRFIFTYMKIKNKKMSSCGRLHSMTLDVNSHVWMFLNWGRPFRLVTPLLECKSFDTTPAQIECGWSFSSVLTKSGVVLSFPISSQSLLWAKFNTKMEELDQIQLSKAHVVDGISIPCYTWDLEIDPVQLPPLPRLPDLRPEHEYQETKLVRIAGMENSLVGLTNKGHIVKFDFGLPNQNAWVYVSFSVAHNRSKFLFFILFC